MKAYCLLFVSLASISLHESRAAVASASERKEEKMALIINKGFKDLLFIGNQARPNIFDLDINRPSVLYSEVIEVDCRLPPALEDKCQIYITGNTTGTGAETVVEMKRQTRYDNTGTGNTGHGNTGNNNSGNYNRGNGNSGDSNIGNNNSGNGNTGDRNRGNRNIGNGNGGNYNTGNDNSGNYNRGNGNSGDNNIGNNNFGNGNTGDGNRGNNNIGDGNSGNNNIGNGNSGDYNTGNGQTGNGNAGNRKTRNDVINEIDEDAVKRDLLALKKKGIESIAIAFAHSYAFHEHKLRVEKIAEELGFTQRSPSDAIMSMVRLVGREFSSCADAYLTPNIPGY